MSLRPEDLFDETKIGGTVEFASPYAYSGEEEKRSGSNELDEEHGPTELMEESDEDEDNYSSGDEFVEEIVSFRPAMSKIVRVSRRDRVAASIRRVAASQKADSQSSEVIPPLPSWQRESTGGAIDESIRFFNPNVIMGNIDNQEESSSSEDEFHDEMASLRKSERKPKKKKKKKKKRSKGSAVPSPPSVSGAGWRESAGNTPLDEALATRQSSTTTSVEGVVVPIMRQSVGATSKAPPSRMRGSTTSSSAEPSSRKPPSRHRQSKGSKSRAPPSR